jgi:hypothetical protein
MEIESEPLTVFLARWSDGGMQYPESGELLVQRCNRDRRRSVAAVVHAHSPRLAAHFTVLDVFLRRTPTGIDGDLNGLVAVRAVNAGCGLRGGVAQRKLVAPITVGRPAGLRTADHF